ncbi:ATP-binding protein [Nostoc sp. FACHB-110]|uniref:hybrid sensor histidine kinase/response regulator n=1 Tax=Nostoc sp. FACHB-110 TaxID=2692834 RepID=UPI001684B756|nr:ATP-binding protein [Nostoc sp. FACHB-110]MBD2437898.1 PAS domain S-box protein [Nostoc sp. FACHB-110]
MQVVVVNDDTQRIVSIKDCQPQQYNQTLIQLGRSQNFQKGNLIQKLQEITEIAAQTLYVKRVGVWLYNQDRTALECVELYEAGKNAHTSGQILFKASYPNYFLSLETEVSLAVDDAIHDKRTQELSTSYLDVLEIASLLDIPIWLGGRVVGVICHEHCGMVRQWTVEEESFASAIANYVALAIESSDRLTAQTALQKTEAKLQAIFQRSGIGIGIADIQGKIVDINPALCQLLGYSREELYGKCFQDYISSQTEDIDIYQQLLLGRCDRIEIDRPLIHKDGKLILANISISLIWENQEQPEFLLAIIQDITERQKTQLKLRASETAAAAGNKAKSEFLAIMSHELRTPLNAIMGLSQLLQQEMVGSLNEKQQEYMSCIYSSGEHLLALINDILDLSKVEAGKEELNILPVSVTDLCNYVISSLRERAAEKGLQLTLEIDPQADTCFGDVRRIKQMLMNLLTNAIKFTSSGQVSLEVKKVLQGITFTVIDTGIGIDSNQFQFLFEPFKQLDSQLNRQYEGTGLGLALTRKLARLHGGDVTVVSTLGEGSRFTLFLPENADLIAQFHQEKEVITSPKVLPDSPLKKRILLAQPEQNTAIFLQDYLEIIGYQVEWLNNSENFLAAMRNFQPNLLLLDEQLFPGIYRQELLNILKQEDDLRSIPIVIICDNQEDVVEFANLQLNNYEYLNKPIRIAQLESILRQFLS